jgi:hypothetical protein
MYTETETEIQKQIKKKTGEKRHAHAQHGVVRGKKPAAVDDVDKLFCLLHKVARRAF